MVAADAATRRHLRDNIYVSGFSVLEASSTSEALVVTRDSKPEVALVDLRIRYEHSQISVKSIPEIRNACTPRPRIIALIGAPPSPSPNQVMEAGGDDYLEDPFCICELLVRVDRLLGVSLPPPRNNIHPHERVRLSDLLEESEHITLVWITIGGLEQLDSVGIDGHSAIGAALGSIISELLPGSQTYWAGTERVAALAPAIQSVTDVAAELVDSISKAISDASLPIELTLRVRAGVRAWAEGKATFLARVTGRVSYGALPIAPVAAGKPPGVTVESVRSRLHGKLITQEFRSISMSHRPE